MLPLNVFLIFLLTPGLLISVPPGPNKQWFMGGQVTIANALVHAALVALILSYVV